MWSWLRSGKRVLTVGSVHLDTIALSRAEDPTEDVTHIGNITHSVGGSAYNIAANLTAYHGRQSAVSDAAVYSILPQHSVLTEIIKYTASISLRSSTPVTCAAAATSESSTTSGWCARPSSMQPCTMPTSSRIATRAPS